MKDKVEIVIWIDGSYSKNETIYLSNKLTREEIIEEINKRFGKLGWYSFDIW